jgi:hypothetical protein
MANTLFRRNEINTFSWWARKFRSIIDYMLVNKESPTLVEGTYVCGGAYMRTFRSLTFHCKISNA